MADRTLGRTLWNLFLALLNATLILVVVSLALAWGVSNNLRSITADFAQTLIDVAPLRDEVAGLRTEVAALREDLATVTAAGGELQSAALTRLNTRAQAVDDKLAAMNARAEALMQDPGVLIDKAVARTISAVADQAGALATCTPENPTGASL